MPQKPFLEAGQIVGTHGVRGEMRVQPWCDSAAQFSGFRTLYWDKDGTRPVKCKSRPHKEMALVTLEGVSTVEEAAALRGKMLYVSRKDIRLPKGRHFIQDLIGLTVRDADTGAEYGKLTDVSQTGSNAVYHMQTPEGKEILIPAIPAIICDIDTVGDVMTIRPMEGLFEDAF